MSSTVKVVVAARFAINDFVEVREAANVVCAHPEADPPEVLYCPKCGTAKAKRVGSIKREFPKPQFALAATEPFHDMSKNGEKIGWFKEWLHESVRDSASNVLGGLDLFDLNPDGWETNKRDFALGKMLFDLREDGHSSVAAMPSEAIAEFVTEVQKKMDDLDLGLGDHEVKVHCILATNY